MRLHLLALFTLSFIAGSGLSKSLSAQDQCKNIVADVENFFNAQKGALPYHAVSNFIPVDVIRGGLKYYYGDHVDWEGLLAYRISSAGWKNRLVKDADRIHDDFLDYVKRRSLPPVEPYKHWVLFRPSNNVNDLWTTEVSLASDIFLHFMDKFNMIFNGGIISEEYNIHRLYRSKNESLELLHKLSSFYNNYKHIEIKDYLYMLKKKGTQKMVLDFLDQNLEPLVVCLYELLANRNLTVYDTFTEIIPQDRFVKYALDLANEAISVIDMDATELNIDTILAAAKKAMHNIDVDSLSAKVLINFLRARTLVLGVDIRRLFIELNEVHRTIGEGWTNAIEGQWPEMVDFISTFYKKTMKSDKFWSRLDELYLEQVESARVQYTQREKKLDKWIRLDLVPFLRSILDYMGMVRSLDSNLIQDLEHEIETFDLNSVLEPPLEKLSSILTRYFLSCYTALYGKPDFSQLGDMANQNSVVNFIKEIVVVDWPEKQEVPKGFPEFVEKLQSAVLLIFTSAWGSCSDPILTN